MRCIECEEIELARVRDQRSPQTLPIPYEALDGFPAGRSPSHLTRRRLLQWGTAGFASIYGAKELGWDAVWESVAQAADEYLEHRRARVRQVREALADLGDDAAHVTAARLAERIYPDVDERVAAVAEMTVAAHLDYVRSSTS